MSEQSTINEFEQESTESVPENESYGKVNLSEVIEPILGKTPRRSNEDFWGEDIKWARAKDISQNETRHIYETEDKMSEKGKNENNVPVMPKDTVVVTARGTLGEAVQLGEKMTFNQTCYGLATKEDLLDDFLYYAWQYVFKQVESVSYGTVFDTITMKSFDDIKIPYPNLEKQRKIANILTNLDDKIEANNRINKVLEKIAQAIFKEWFVDFGPYEEFKDSELGEIPKEFSVGQVEELVTLKNGEYIKKEDQGEKGEYPVYGSNGKTERTDDKNVEEPCITIGRVGSIGEIHRVEEEAWISDNCIIARPKDSAEYYYLYLLLTKYNFEKFNQGSSHPMITQEVIKSRDVVIPPRKEISKFEEKVEILFREVLRIRFLHLLSGIFESEKI